MKRGYHTDMKAKKVYEALGDIFVGKGSDEIESGLANKYPHEYVVMVMEVANLGYKPILPFLYDPDEMTKKTFSYQGKVMDFHTGVDFKLKAQEELDEMDHTYNDSMYRETAHIDNAGLDILKLRESGNCIMQSDIRFDGFWPSWEYNDNKDGNEPYVRSRYTGELKSDEEIKQAVRFLIPKLEKALEKEIKDLKKYADNW